MRPSPRGGRSSPSPWLRSRPLRSRPRSRSREGRSPGRASWRGDRLRAGRSPRGGRSALGGRASLAGWISRSGAASGAGVASDSVPAPAPPPSEDPPPVPDSLGPRRPRRRRRRPEELPLRSPSPSALGGVGMPPPCQRSSVPVSGPAGPAGVLGGCCCRVRFRDWLRSPACSRTGCRPGASVRGRLPRPERLLEPSPRESGRRCSLGAGAVPAGGAVLALSGAMSFLTVESIFFSMYASVRRSRAVFRRGRPPGFRPRLRPASRRLPS